MSRDVRVGRVMVAALQQAIAEELPTRSEFYDHWLGPDGRRDGTLGLAPMAAVVGFLRTEGEAYRRIVERAGQFVAEWTWNDSAAWWRYTVARAPQRLRVRMVCRRFRAVVADTCAATTVRAKVGRSVVSIEVEQSVFCHAREVPPAPLCAFYAALALAMFSAAGLIVSGQMDRCRARGDGPGKESGCGGTFAVSVGPA